MPLTQVQREAHYGRMLVNLIQNTNTTEEISTLDSLMHILIPNGKKYVQAGTLGTEADRLEAMQFLRDRAYDVVHSADTANDAAAAHVATNHYHATLDLP